MKTATNAQRSWMTAITFAEAGEWETARAMLPVSSGAARQANWLERIFMAVAFAEAGLRDDAIALAEARTNVRKDDGFLEAVGLRGIRVTYGVLAA